MAAGIVMSIYPNDRDYPGWLDTWIKQIYMPSIVDLQKRKSVFRRNLPDKLDRFKYILDKELKPAEYLSKAQ